MLEGKILRVAHSEGPTGLIRSEPLVNLLSRPGWKRLWGERARVGARKVEGGGKPDIKTTLVIPTSSFPDLSASLALLLLGKQRFMIRLGEMAPRDPYEIS